MTKEFTVQLCDSNQCFKKSCLKLLAGINVKLFPLASILLIFSLIIISLFFLSSFFLCLTEIAASTMTLLFRRHKECRMNNFLSLAFA